MPRQGLSQDVVLRAAVDLIEEGGLPHFSMGELARRLQVKPASLYNHVESLEQLLDPCRGRCRKKARRGRDAGHCGKTGAGSAVQHWRRPIASSHGITISCIGSLWPFQNGRTPYWNRRRARSSLPFCRCCPIMGLPRSSKFTGSGSCGRRWRDLPFTSRREGFSHYSADPDESFRLGVQCLSDGLRRAGGNVV